MMQAVIYKTKQFLTFIHQLPLDGNIMNNQNKIFNLYLHVCAKTI